MEMQMKRMALRDMAFALVSALALLGLPALGVVLAGKPVADYLEFPPLTQHVQHAGFSWPVFVAMALGILAVILPFDLRAWLSRSRSAPSCLRPSADLKQALPKGGPTTGSTPLTTGPCGGRPESGCEIGRRTEPPAHQQSRFLLCKIRPQAGDPTTARQAAFRLPHSATRRAWQALRTPHSSFPWWGWLGVAAGAVTWTLAWTRFPWFAPLQPFTFSPLWFAYIVAINALTLRRTGHCMLKDRPRYFLALFLASAAFWWFFEYLNRFVQNWYYAGVTDITPLEYFIFATLPFSTVLPAVLGTYDYIASFPATGAGLDGFLPIAVRRPRALAWIALLASGAGLLGIGIFPDCLFALLWLSPLIVIASLQTIGGQSNIFTPSKSGCWRRAYLLAMAALICGFFWEMWNYWSLAQWKYSVPFVGAFKIFEMPILGFAGYLPFGLECAVIGDIVARLCDHRDGEGAEGE
jgi:hypothetical protein